MAADKMLVSTSEGQSVEPSVDTKSILNGNVKKRSKRVKKKVIRTCAFCRRRKLKCDNARPMCSTCVSRKFSTCIYEDTVDTRKVKLEEVFDSVPNLTLLKKVEELEKALQAVDPDTAAKISHQENSVVNPVADIFFLQSKGSGRKILYGPTSSRTYIRLQSQDFLDRFKQLYAKVKEERNKWKSKNKLSVLKELEVIDGEFELGDTRSLFTQAVAALPSYEATRRAIQQFFDNTLFHEISSTLDFSKVMNDFYQEFEPGEYINDGKERRIAGVKVSQKRNFYKMAVIVMIVCLQHYNEGVPIAIQRFHIALSGTTTSKILYLERTQFLLLRYYYRELYAPCGDEIHMLNLVDTLCTSATNIGLHLNHSIYEGQEASIGSMKAMENLWIWVIYADVNTSLHVGRPLLINRDLLDDSLPSVLDNDTDKPGSYFWKLKRLLKIARRHIHGIYNRRVIPNLVQYSEDIAQYIEKEFPELYRYTTYEGIDAQSASDYRVLTLAMNLSITYYSLRFIVTKERSLELKNNILQQSLIGVSMVVNLTLYCYTQDLHYYPDAVGTSKYITPYLSFSLSATNTLFQKAITLFCAMLYYKLTLFERGKFLKKELKDIDQHDLTTLRVAPGRNISLISSFRVYSDLFDRWHNGNASKGMMEVVVRSHTFIVSLALERVNRTLLAKIIEYRTKAEDVWIPLEEMENGVAATSGSMAPPAQIQHEPQQVQPQQAQQTQVQPHTHMAHAHEGSTNGSGASTRTHSSGTSQGTSQGTSVGMQGNGCPSRIMDVETPLSMVSPVITRDKSANGSIAGSDISSMYADEILNVPNVDIAADSFLDMDSTEPEDENSNKLAQMLADEFWTNYNSGFPDIVDRIDYNTLFE